MSDGPPIGRAFLAGVGWAIAWSVAAIALAFELARLLTPDALQSRFFYMWTFGRSVFWLMPGFAVGATFVFAEAWWRGARSRDTSGAGWSALLLGASLGLLLGLGLEAISMLDGDGEGFELLTLAFTTTLAATCGLATFLLDRLGVRLVARWKRRAT